MAAYENIYQTERDNLSESDLFILDNRMASCAADAVIKQGKTDPIFFEKFTRYLKEYLDLARTTQKDRISTEEPCTRLMIIGKNFTICVLLNILSYGFVG